MKRQKKRFLIESYLVEGNTLARLHDAHTHTNRKRIHKVGGNELTDKRTERKKRLVYKGYNLNKFQRRFPKTWP